MERKIRRVFCCPVIIKKKGERGAIEIKFFPRES